MKLFDRAIEGAPPDVPRPHGRVQEHRGKSDHPCQVLGCHGRAEVYATDLASCQACGADYFVRRRKGVWSLQLIRPGRT